MTTTTPNPAPSGPRKLSDVEKSILLQDATAASKVRRNTRKDHPARQAARRLESTLLALRDEGVTVTALAEACGVTRRAIQQRLEKYK